MFLHNALRDSGKTGNLWLLKNAHIPEGVGRGITQQNYRAPFILRYKDQMLWTNSTFTTRLVTEPVVRTEIKLSLVTVP